MKARNGGSLIAATDLQRVQYTVDDVSLVDPRLLSY